MSGEAFGAPGIAPTWCSSDKDFVTTGLGSGRVWITIGHGIIDEVYWPSTGEPQIRDFSFYLVGEKGFIDLKRVRRYRFSTPGPYLPTPTITHYGDDYELTLEILPDTRRDALLVRFNIKGPYRLVAVLAPHLGSTGRDNRAWVEDGRGYAQRGDFAVCFSTNALFRHLSAGYVGASDGWQDLHLHGGLTFDFSSASHGTVALSGEAVGSSGTIGVAFAETPRGAHTLLRTALAEGFDGLRQEFLDRWQWWGSKLKLPRPDERLGDAGLLSAAVLKTHEDRTYPGAMVASLSVPWGNSTDTLGGYHLVWPRDATLTAFALLAANQVSQYVARVDELIRRQQGKGSESGIAWPYQVIATERVGAVAPGHAQAGDHRPGIGAILVDFKHRRRQQACIAQCRIRPRKFESAAPVIPVLQKFLPQHFERHRQRDSRTGAGPDRIAAKAER